MASTNDTVAKKQEAATIYLRDFKQWLKGVEDMQGPDWAPNADQWKKIREKIEMIADTTSPAPIYNNVAPVSFVPPTGPTAMEPRPAIRRNPPLPLNPQGALANPSPKTPDIDTSTGPYVADQFV